MASVLTRLLVIALSSALSACGGADNALQSRPEGPSGTLTARLAAALVQPGAYGDTALRLARPFDAASTRAIVTALDPRGLAPARDVDPGSGDLEPAPCEPRITGNVADSDGDAIPVRATYTFDCNVTEPYAAHLGGGFSVEDANDSIGTPLAGYAIRVPRYTLDVTLGREAPYAYMTEGTYDATITAGGISSAAAIRRATLVAGRTQAVRIYVDSTVTAASPEAPDAAGTIDLHGFIAVDTAEAVYTLELQGTGLRYDRACGHGFFREGRIELRDGAGHVLTYDFAACHAKTAFDGTALEGRPSREGPSPPRPPRTE